MTIDEHFTCCLCDEPADFRADIGCLCEACQMEQMKLACDLLVRFGLRPGHRYRFVAGYDGPGGR